MQTSLAPIPLKVRAAAALELKRRATGSDNSGYLAQAVNLAGFTRAIYPSYEQTDFQTALDDKLAQVARYVETGGAEGIGRLMIFMPPRHGKSLKVSKLFPAWFIGRNPDKRMIMASYSATLAGRNSRYVRNVIKSDRFHGIFPRVNMAADTASATEWDIADHEGGAIAAGVGGGLTGHGAHLLTIDDPTKSRAEAESQTYRDNLKEWYGDVYTRLQEPGGAIILMHQRWHDDDLAGWLLSEGVDKWVVLSLPALAEDNDYMGREPGQALWPERYGVEKLDAIAANLGEYRFAAEYQQTPKPKSGGLFDTHLIEVVDFPPECTEIVRFYDLAATAKKKSDYTAGCKMGITRDERPVILDVWRRQLTAPDVQEGIVQNAAIDGTAVRIRLEGEKQGIVELDYLLRDPRMRPYNIDKKPPTGDKYTRAGPFAARVKAGKVLMLRGAWNREYLDELSMFNSGAHDDQVDATSGAYDMLANPSGVISFDTLPDSINDWRG